MAKVQSQPPRLTTVAWSALLALLAITTACLGAIILVPGTARTVIDLAALLLGGTIAAQFGLIHWRSHRDDLPPWLLVAASLSSLVGAAGGVMAALTNG
ncbi:hypothetical protein [Caulobacter endophyticus]|uniref:hypothetical protein n=1 Tax=Caulobacter endophyticus TaxID=2172652 RepID=UPI00240F47D4|nr:hypothetical protein [Caulobacter endophyticus]MDG2531801.1 hypothetical protein [Caulobacter endophyticus]